MTMYTKIASLSGALSMKDAILEAWKAKLVGWFYVGLAFLVAFTVMFWVLPRFLPKKVTKTGKYVKSTLTILGIGLLLLLLSLGGGYGIGLGKGKGIGSGDGTGVGVGKGDVKEKKHVTEGELDIAVTGCTVYVDAEPVEIDRLKARIKDKYDDTLTVVLIDDYSDYGTYRKVISILNEILTENQYEKRKEN